jgi:hypothetical protein
MTTERERVLCVTLSEAEWKAFVARHPQPVDWLRQQILSQLAEVHGASADLPAGAGSTAPPAN